MKVGLVSLIALSGAPWGLGVPVSISPLGGPYTQDFNSLAQSDTSGSLPGGWAFVETGAHADSTYAAGTGSSNAGNTYSFGSSGSSDRALGGLRSGNLIPQFGVEFRNETGQVIASLEIEYWGEQWRLGASGRVDRLEFQYSLNATSLTSGTWADVDALDFESPQTNESTGAKDGNASSYRSLRTGVISGLSISPGATFWLRWEDFDTIGADDGLGVDDFKLTAFGASLHSAVTDAGATLPLCLAGLISLGIGVHFRGWASGGRKAGLDGV